MDEEAVDLGGDQLEGAFEGGDDGVHTSHGEIVGEGAVAADLGVFWRGGGVDR